MNRITEKFKQLKRESRTGLVPYIMAGYPSLRASQKIIESLAKIGADLIEIGIPYSDPLADGTTIQKAGEVALSQGISTPQVLEMVKEVRKNFDVPLAIMCYYNLIYKYGLKDFVDDAYSSGIDGVIIPDLPPEEASSWLGAANNRIGTTFLLAPTSSRERIERITRASQGFIYCVSLTGVTGARQKLSPDLTEFISSVRLATKKPLAVGFGISTASQAREIAKISDAIIVGSALIDKIETGRPEQEQVKKVADFARGILEAIKSR